MTRKRGNGNIIEKNEPKKLGKKRKNANDQITSCTIKIYEFLPKRFHPELNNSESNLCFEIQKLI